MNPTGLHPGSGYGGAVFLLAALLIHPISREQMLQLMSGNEVPALIAKVIPHKYQPIPACNAIEPGHIFVLHEVRGLLQVRPGWLHTLAF